MISSPLPRPIKEFYIVWRVKGGSVTRDKKLRAPEVARCGYKTNSISPDGIQDGDFPGLGQRYAVGRK